MDIEQLAGTKLGNYEIQSLLGRGGMGVVYKARQVSLHRTVALKILSTSLSSDESFVKRFQREAHAVAQLSHQNIAHIYDVSEEDGIHYFSMEYVEGQTLDDILKEKVRLDTDEAVRIISRVADGIEHAHRNDIIHRDIKSSNILLDVDDNVKVMDFGLAKLIGRTKLTETSTIMGTVDYMSPEQARGETVDNRTDIWSLGIVLYEMLTGRVPFDAESDAAMVHKIIYEEPPELESLNPDTPPGLVAVVSRAMVKDKEDRYASVTEFLEDIRNYAFLEPGEPISREKHGRTRPMSTAKQPRPKRKDIGTAVVVIGVLAVAFLAAALLSRKPASVVVPETPEVKQQIRYCTSADGTRIAYAVVGNGPPVVRCLGWFTHLEYEWNDPFRRPEIDANAANFQVVRYDGRGMGLSDRQVNDFSLEAQVADLEAVVDTLGLERFILNGISQSGPVAITYAVRHPERISHLMLFGSYARMGWFLDTEEEQQEFDALLTIIRRGWDSDDPAHRQFFTGWFMPDPISAEALKSFNRLQQISTSAENAAALAIAFREMNVTDILSQVKVPTLVIHLRGDAAVPFEAGRDLAAGIPGAQFLPVEGRNHYLVPQDPAGQEIGRGFAEFLLETANPDPQSQALLEKNWP